MFKTIKEVELWLFNHDLYIGRDIIEKDDGGTPCFWVQTLEDRSVGIFPTELSPTFTHEDVFVRWMNDNADTIEQFVELFDDYTTSDAKAIIESLSKGEAGVCQKCEKTKTVHLVKSADDSSIGSVNVCQVCDEDEGIVTLADFAKQLRKDFPTNYKMYIAILLNDETGVYDLEVESTPNDIIGGVYATDTSKLNKARKEADKLEEELKKVGITVVKTRKEWELCEDYD